MKRRYCECCNYYGERFELWGRGRLVGFVAESAEREELEAHLERLRTRGLDGAIIDNEAVAAACEHHARS